jgi:CD36 family.
MISFFQKSGLPLDVTVRFQINMALGDLSGIPRANKFSNMILPMLWTEFVSAYVQQPCFIIKLSIRCPVPCLKLGLLVIIQNLRRDSC